MGCSWYFFPTLAVAVLGIITWANTCLAQEDARPPVTLEWAAPAGCPSQPEMLDQITRTIGKTSSIAEPVAARIVVSESTPGTFRGEVDLSAAGQASRRAIESGSCRALSDALALIVALAVNPDARPVATASAPSRSEPEATRAPPPSPDTFTIGVSALLDAGTLPSVAFGAELEGSWRRGRAEVGVIGAFAASRPARLSSHPNEGADFWLAGAGARGCYTIVQGVLRIGPCVGVGVQWIFATGFGSQEPRDSVGRIETASLGARVVAPLSSRFGLHLGAEELLAFERPTFVIENSGTVFAVPVFSFRANLGAEVCF